jgi:hypothetical protein
MEAADRSHTSPAAAPEGRGAFGGFVGPRTLVGLVATAAPYLFDGSDERSASVPAHGAGRFCDGLDRRFGWWTALRAAHLVPATPEPTPQQRVDYFALCLAAHFASAGTFVPTDVDAKIRHAAWFEELPQEERRDMARLALGLARWDVSPVSARLVHVDGFADEHGPVSGHDGERLSVLVGGHLACLAHDDAHTAAELEAAIEQELEREAAAFAAAERAAGSGASVRVLVDLATSLTHNAGDVVQALSSKSARAFAETAQQRWGDLARTGGSRFGGAFVRAAAIYREIGAPEGHRHYPLREVKALRTSSELLLPLGPLLDEWGERIARWPAFGARERAAVVSALVAGCRRVPGQDGYHRALAGLESALPRGLDDKELAEHYDNATRRGLAETSMRKKLAVRRVSYESSVMKRARAALAAV